MVDAVKLASTAQRLISKNGREFIFKKEKSGSADPAQPWREKESGAPTALPINCVSLEFENKELSDLIRSGDKKILVPAKNIPAGAELITYDTVQDGTSLFKIINVAEVKPGKVTIIYIVQARL